MEYKIRKDLIRFKFGGFREEYLGRKVIILDRDNLDNSIYCKMEGNNGAWRFSINEVEEISNKKIFKKIPSVFSSKLFASLSEKHVLCIESNPLLRTKGNIYQISRDGRYFTDNGNYRKTNQKVFTRLEPALRILSIMGFKTHNIIYSTSLFKYNLEPIKEIKLEDRDIFKYWGNQLHKKGFIDPIPIDEKPVELEDDFDFVPEPKLDDE